jgi:glycosyltransferase involved in cell wall biosynthesis
MKSDFPLVSIVIPTYNCADYIEGAVKSVLNQTYPNIEILVIDDGSKDNTLELLSKYRNEIIVITQTNQGVSRARNIGIHQAKGKYIANLDADDRWFPNRLEIMIPQLEQGKCNIIISNFYKVNEKRERISNLPAFSNSYKVPIKNQYNSMLYEATSFTLMISEKKALLEIGGYDESLNGEAEDYDLWLRLLKTGATWGYEPTPLAEYMIRQNSLSKDYSKKRGLALKKIFKKHTDVIGKFKAYRLYRYHLGGYKWDMLIVSIREKNMRKILLQTVNILKSPTSIPVIFVSIISFILKSQQKRL